MSQVFLDAAHVELAIATIDENLSGILQREAISADEVADILLDVRRVLTRGTAQAVSMRDVEQ